MSEVVKMRTNAGDCDWRGASNRLSWAVWHAEQMGFVVPTDVTAATMILQGQAKVSYLSNAGTPTILCIGRPETDEDFDDQMAMVEFICSKLKERRLRAKAREAEASVIGFSWPPA